MGYWKEKVLPKIKKVFDKTSTGNKKAAASEACQSFDESKEQINKEFEGRRTELQPKVLEIYEASSAEIKTFIKEPKEAGLKKNSVVVHKFLEELVKIEFPGSKPVSEAFSKFGPALVPGPVLFVFEKVSTFIVTEEKVDEPPPAAATTEEAGGNKEKEILVVEEEKKEEKKEEEEEKEDVEKVEEEMIEVAVEEAEKKEAAPATTEPAKGKEFAEPPKP
ncbi:hypothetical protein I3843_10G103400 [Carya illinoinensis]|uniref:Plasma membrane-associated cation-binding protein 1 n=1 Tax=Carya illinoinensis TaxID=32201 RepID=A0A8T1PA60_CARIL|nr:plasma membrane-associated cation-binding protein 1-like [Carya illinoinensis]KAG2685036.1 hypothetical protein I3760_10G105900 [Carya illinoinensis]KAG6639545.1 hypothetical protein CIPAW_10G108500 [Carya illinoinensis]KAG6692287.1 hypothetical protein I3842_10G107800 [Carya illinoinensis]KAG7960067.1 hypothetical protein I3843_10G103400 [Carya illinoinensis]